MHVVAVISECWLASAILSSDKLRDSKKTRILSFDKLMPFVYLQVLLHDKTLAGSGMRVYQTIKMGPRTP